MIIVSCPDCGKPLLWHLAHEHRCVHNHGAAPGQKPQKSSPARKPTTRPVPKTEPSKSSSPSSRRIVTPPVNTPVYGKQEVYAVHKSANHCPACGQPLLIDRRVYMRDYMRDYRARQKAPE